jgi:hypothetical protein
MSRAALLLVLVGAAGCSPPWYLWGGQPVVFRAQPRKVKPPRPHAPAVAAPHTGPAALVEKALHERGLDFGTDGSVASLYEYLHASQPTVAPSQARAGDVVFFDLGAGCGGHVGLVDAVDREGRIAFRERREGELLHSYADPGQPTARRDDHGRVRNSFLRPRLPEDPPTYRYYAGEMLCAVIRVPRR